MGTGAQGRELAGELGGLDHRAQRGDGERHGHDG
jgi:hypothetical protein